jgi:NAD+ kinase
VEVHLIANVHREDALQAARDTIEWLRARGVQPQADQESGAILGLPIAKPNRLGKADLMLSFGGDGTLIRAADVCSAHGTPILGVAYGTFGFVTQCRGEAVQSVLEKFFAGEQVCGERMMIQADLIRGDMSVITVNALNEVAVQRSVKTKMMVFRVTVDGVKLTSYPADGVLVATPTGSTAYSLSTGGPIVDPRTKALVLSAIAPHTLSSRPLVLFADSTVEIALITGEEAVVSVDGQLKLHMIAGDRIEVRRSPRVTRLVIVDPADFAKKLNGLLFWSQSIWREVDQDGD